MNGFLIYLAKRFGQFVFVVFTGVTLAFLIAFLTGGPDRADPFPADKFW